MHASSICLKEISQREWRLEGGIHKKAIYMTHSGSKLWHHLYISRSWCCILAIVKTYEADPPYCWYQAQPASLSQYSIRLDSALPSEHNWRFILLVVRFKRVILLEHTVYILTMVHHCQHRLASLRDPNHIPEVPVRKTTTNLNQAGRIWNVSLSSLV